MIQQACIQQYDHGQIEPEHEELFRELSNRGILCRKMTQRQLASGNFAFDASTLFAGDHDFMRCVFALGRIPYTERSTYPESLLPFLKRNLWETTVKELLMDCRNDHFTPCFVKPKTETKAFTGFVLRSSHNSYKLFGLPNNLSLHCSEPVNWVSEWRVFVVQSEIVGINHYSGDPERSVDLEIIESAVKMLENTPEKTAGYALDFGVLDSGETALVEWNDGFSLGAYGLHPEHYSRLLITRWQELCGQRK